MIINLTKLFYQVMNRKLTFLFSAAMLSVVGVVSAQSYYDDDIYFDASKAKKQQTATAVSDNQNRYYNQPVIDYPAADTYTINGTRTISVDDYNRRGIFATDSLSADTAATDFRYTRLIEKYYNPDIVTSQNDPELANIYYLEPDQVNIYVNTPSGYWGYDYLSPYASWNLSFGYPYYNNYWRWSSPWYWNTWYDPYWSWSWGWGPGWASGWGPGWGPSWSWGWGPSWGWGWSAPSSPRHPGGPMAPSYRPSNPPASGMRPGLSTGNRHQGTAMRPGYNTAGSNSGVRPGNNNGNYRPGTTSGNGNSGMRPGNSTSRPSNNNNNYSRPSNNNNNNYSRPSNTNGGRTPSYSGGGSRSGGFSGGGSSSGRSAGGRGRH